MSDVQSFWVSCDFLLSAYMVSHFSVPQSARRHFSIFSSMLSPCLASVCETSLRSRTVRPPFFPLRIILLHQPNFYSVTLCVQVAAVFLFHWEKYLHSFLQFTQLITNPKYFLWKSLREKRMNNIVPVNPVRLVCLDRGYVHYKPSLLGLDNIYIPV